jgi:TonB family protein
MKSKNGLRIVSGVMLVIALIVVFAACCTHREAMTPPETVDIVRMTSLPPIEQREYQSQFKVNVIFHVRKDGSIADVRVLSSSGDELWDVTAADSMRNWRFSPLPPDSPAEGVFIRRTILVQIQESVFLTLGELYAGSREEADSFYTLLRQGYDFLKLVSEIEAKTSTDRGGFMGTVNIAQYPEQVRDRLRKLREYEMTQPIRVGDTYVIYKRFGSE